MKYGDKKTVTIYLTQEEIEKIDEIAVFEERSRNYIIRKAITNFLRDYFSDPDKLIRK